MVDKSKLVEIDHVRTKLVRLIAEAKRAMWGIGKASCDLVRYAYIADHLITNGVTIQEWIPVTERMPEERKSAVPALGSYSMPVLVVWERKCTGDRYVREGYTREGKFVNKTYNDEIVPVAWMPLPQPPKEGETE